MVENHLVQWFRLKKEKSFNGVLEPSRSIFINAGI